MNEQVALIAARYTQFADGYKRWFSPVIRPMALPLIQALPIRESKRVLDVGCGVGALSDDLRAAAPDAALVGVDRSEGMLTLAPVPTAVGDAMTLPVATDSVDAAVAVFMLHHLPDPAIALAEMRRILRGDGLVATATWGGRRDHLAYSVLMEEINASTPPSGVTLDNTEQLETTELMIALLTAAGFASVNAWTVRHEHRWGRDHFWSNYTEYGRTRQRIDALPHDKRVELLARLRERLAAVGDEGFAWRPDVVYCVAKP